MSPSVHIEQLLEHSGWARRLAAGLVADASRADDAVQDAWLAALTRPPRNATNLKSWLAFLVKRAVRRSARGEVRRARRDQSASRPEAVHAADALERAELQRTLVDAVLALREPYKTAIVLAYFEELPPRSIARRLGLSPSTVRSHIRRGLALLRQDLAGRTDGRESLLPAITALARGPRGTSGPPWTAGSASTGGLIVMTKMKIAAVLVLAVAGVCLWMRGAHDSGASTAKEERPTALALSHPPKGLPLQPPDTGSSRTAGPVEAVASQEPSAPTSDDDEGLLHGRVVDGKGAPVPEAEVRALRPEGRSFEYLGDMEYWKRETQAAETRSSSDGEFSMRLSRGRIFDLRVHSAGFAEKQVGGVQVGVAVVIALRVGATVAGVVRRSADASPVAGARLIFESDEGFEPMWEGTTDADGRYLAEGLDPGRASVMAIPEAERPENLSLELHEGERLVRDFELVVGGTIEGEVRDRSTGFPIAGAEVSWWSFLHKVARTDSAGRYVLSGLRDWKSVPIAARADGYGLLETRVEPKARESVRADFELRRARTARGRVLTREGVPVAGAYVAALARSFDREVKLPRQDVVASSTVADGSFEIRNLRPDLPHALLVRKEGFATTFAGFGERENADTTIDLGDVVLPRMSTLAGKIVDAAGRGIAGVGIQVRNPVSGAAPDAELFAMQSASSDDDGRFRLVDLPPGVQSLRFYKTGWCVLEKVEVELAEGERRRDFVIQLGGGLSLSGRVLDPEGAVAAGATVCVSGGSLSAASRHCAIAEADGSFVFSGLDPGDYKLRAEPLPQDSRGEGDEWIASRLESASAGATGVVLQLQRGVAIEGRVTTPDGPPPSRVWIVAFESTGARVSWTVTDEKGAFRLQAGAGTAVEVKLWPARPDPQSFRGFSADESAPAIAVQPGVRAGAKDVVVAVPR